MKVKTVIFIHGMYMTSLCWEKWRDYSISRGYECLAPAWPGRDKSVEALRELHPDPQLGNLTLSDVVKHYTAVIKSLPEKPVLIGHSMGGLAVQLLLQHDLAVAGIAISSAPPMGVISVKWSFLKSNWPHITPFVSQSQPIEMTFSRFQYTFVNGMPLAEQRAAYERYMVPESRCVPRESVLSRIDFKRPRPPLLLIAGSTDHVIPASLVRTNFARYQPSVSMTSIMEFPGRNHFIVNQKDWEEVAAYIHTWLADQGI